MPLYFAATTALTSTGPVGALTPITPVPVPSAPTEVICPGLTLLKLLTIRPDCPMLISSRFELVPNEFSGKAVRAPRLVCEQPPVAFKPGGRGAPIRKGCVRNVIAEPCELMAEAP